MIQFDLPEFIRLDDDMIIATDIIRSVRKTGLCNDSESIIMVITKDFDQNDIYGYYTNKSFRDEKFEEIVKLLTKPPTLIEN